MTLNGAITQLVEMRDNSFMPAFFKPYFDKVIETVSECEEQSAQPELDKNDIPEQGDSAKFGVKTGETCTDCISRQDAIDDLHGKDPSQIWDTADIEVWLNALPSAQPDIIRCKECKYSEHWYRDRRRCFLWSEDGVSVFDDGFCNYAERRQE